MMYSSEADAKLDIFTFNTFSSLEKNVA